MTEPNTTDPLANVATFKRPYENDFQVFVQRMFLREAQFHNTGTRDYIIGFFKNQYQPPQEIDSADGRKAVYDEFAEEIIQVLDIYTNHPPLELKPGKRLEAALRYQLRQMMDHYDIDNEEIR